MEAAGLGISVIVRLLGISFICIFMIFLSGRLMQVIGDLFAGLPGIMSGAGRAAHAAQQTATAAVSGGLKGAKMGAALVPGGGVVAGAAKVVTGTAGAIAGSTVGAAAGLMRGAAGRPGMWRGGGGDKSQGRKPGGAAPARQDGWGPPSNR